jgi:hypothetical protein
LPDGIFAYQKYQFGYIWESLGIEINGVFIPFGIIYSHLVNVLAI